MISLLLTAYLGMVSVKEKCVDYDCTPIKRYKNTPCKITVDANNNATAFGLTYYMRRVAYGRTTIWEGRVGNNFLHMFFRPADKILRAYISEYSDAHTYDRWTCEFGRQGESGW